MYRQLRLVAASAAAPAALLAALLVLAACGNEGRTSSPTEPLFPAAATPTPTPLGSPNGLYYFNLGRESGTGSPEVQILVDNVTLYSGPLLAVSPWDYDVYPLYLSGSLGDLSAGRHTLTLRLTSQEFSPDTYGLIAAVNADGHQVASWHESVTLATGGAWTGEFVLD